MNGRRDLSTGMKLLLILAKNSEISSVISWLVLDSFSKCQVSLSTSWLALPSFFMAVIQDFGSLSLRLVINLYAKFFFAVLHKSLHFFFSSFHFLKKVELIFTCLVFSRVFSPFYLKKPNRSLFFSYLNEFDFFRVLIEF